MAGFAAGFQDIKPVVAILKDVCDQEGHVKLCSRWSEALQSQGLEVLEIDPTITDRREIFELLSRVDGIFLPGGNTNIHPSRYGVEPISPSEIFGEGRVPRHQFSHERDLVSKILVEHALESDKPLLGVCRGMQELNVALGGTMQQRLAGGLHDSGYQAGNEWRDLVHAVEVEPGSLLAEAFQRAGSVDQTSIHRQGMLREDIAPDLVISAMADDGLVVEAIEHPTKYILGVQFHAELWDEQPLNQKVFASFAGAVRVYTGSDHDMAVSPVMAEERIYVAE